MVAERAIDLELLFGEKLVACGFVRKVGMALLVVENTVIFVSGHIDYYLDDPADGVGHVGIYTGEETVIHAATSIINIVENPIAEFIGNNRFRGARRYVPKDREVITFELPKGREVESADDIKWIVLQSLS